MLAEPLRRKLYDYVAERGGDVGRAEAAEAVGARRNLVAFHLDKLVEAGLLDVTRGKLTGREGPGSGRPAKLYRRSHREHAVQLPPRDYGTAAALLADAVERAGADEALYASAREEGERRGAAQAAQNDGGAAGDSGSAAGGPVSAAALAHWLEHHGYEPAPVEAAPGSDAQTPARAGAHPLLRLRNCPFDAVARSHPPLACGMNLELLRGLLSGAGADSFRADMAPAPRGCCVLISAIAADSKTNLD
ncbi:Helix-turn-helix domain protein [Streptomonospora litoralis]|uniref:Helix-turn-helix domain protein n=1 Tax=Streptomonospora litoralis TaxID=2498135 RepID=A0A4P6PV74_9ACTN|nr:Helix-turn-helix domain protein [Streptomonospora litoralis]